jgi:hypothetical protein
MQCSCKTKLSAEGNAKGSVSSDEEESEAETKEDEMEDEDKFVKEQKEPVPKWEVLAELCGMCWQVEGCSFAVGDGQFGLVQVNGCSTSRQVQWPLGPLPPRRISRGGAPRHSTQRAAPGLPRGNKAGRRMDTRAHAAWE